MSDILDIPVAEAPAEAPATLPAQTAAPVTEPSVGTANTGNLGDGLPDTVRLLLEKKKWTDIEQMAKGYEELEKLHGVGKHLVIPDAEDAQGWEDVYKEMGRPDTADKYELNYDGELQVSDELVGAFKEYAHGLGLSQKQFDEIVKFQVDAVASQEGAYTEMQQATVEKNIQTLKAKYGIEYDTKIRGARQAADALGIYQTLEEKGLASDPAIIDMLVQLAANAAEDTLAPQTPVPAQKTPQEELEEIKANPAFLNKFHVDHKAVVAKFMAINQAIANTGQTRMPSSR